MKYLNIMAVLASLMCISNRFAYAAGKNVNTCTNICAGNNVACKEQKAACDVGNTDSSLFGLNFFKQKMNWNVGRMRSENLGNITNETEYTVRLPAAGQKKLMSFTPTQGSKAGIQIDILFVSFDILSSKLPTGLPSVVKDEIDIVKNKLKNNEINYRYMTKVYRKLGNESQWTDMYEIFSENRPNDPDMSAEFTLYPDGLVKTNHPIINTKPDGSIIKVSESEILDLAQPL